MCVSLWLFQATSWPSSHSWQRGLSVLTEVERQRILRFHQQSDRLRSLAGRLLVRCWIMQQTLQPLTAFSIITHIEGGKPAVQWLVGDAVPASQGHLDFNLSHHGDWVALAGVHTPVHRPPVRIGVDVVQWTLDDDGDGQVAATLEMLRDQFSEREWTQLLAEQQSLRSRRCHAYWALKEAYLKAVGCGIARGPPLASVEFTVAQLPSEPGTSIMQGIQLSLQGRPVQGWQFALYMIDAGHLVAVAVDAGWPTLPSATVISSQQLDDWVTQVHSRNTLDD